MSWQRSYLTNRQQFVFVLPPQPLYLKVYPRVRCSAPFYSSFTCCPLVVSRHHILHFHCYADDIQLYISTRSITAEIHSALGTMSIKSPQPFSKRPVTECIQDNAVTWLYSHNSNDDNSFIANILHCIVISIPIIILNMIFSLLL